MINSRRDLKEYLAADSINYNRVKLNWKRGGFVKYIYTRLKSSPISDQTKIWQYIKNLRYVEYYINKGTFFARIVSFYYMHNLKKLSYRTGFQIPPNVLGKGITIWHWGTIIINSDTKIGEYCILRPGLVIGENNGIKPDSPIIGDYVDIHSGSKIFGKITIGSDVIIGANSVISKDVPSHSVIVGCPARIIKSRDSITDNWKKI